MFRSVRRLTTSARLVSRRNAPAPTVYIDTGLVIAAVGRPNVGKSTLFNALSASVRGRGSEGRDNPTPFVFVKSVVDPTPGVTRDPRRSVASVGDLLFTIIDTPGLERPLSRRALRNPKVNSIHISSPSGPTPSLVASSALCEDKHYRSLYDSMEAATVSNVRDADIAMLVFDASEGITTLDESIASWLREEWGSLNDTSKRILLLGNKCDRSGAEQGTMDAFRLGLGDPIAISGEHKLGFGDLYNFINSAYLMKKMTTHLGLDNKQMASTLLPTSDEFAQPKLAPESTSDEREQLDQSDENPFDDEMVVGVPEMKGEEPLTKLVVSIIGRPNVGKSTLLNRLVGKEASLVGPASGVTRDAVMSRWEPKTRNAVRADVPVFLIDTAGVRNKSKVDDMPLERLSVQSTIRALRHSHVVMFVIDAEDGLTVQDVKLVQLAVMEGRAIVIVVNKMDKIDESHRKEWRNLFDIDVRNQLHSIPGVEIVEVSATSNWEEKGEAQSGKLFGAVHRARVRWEKRIKTSALNRFLLKFNERAVIGGAAQVRRNRRGVAKFMSQKKIRPPMFRIDGANAVSQTYIRQLSNELRKEFGLQGVPIRVKRPSRR